MRRCLSATIPATLALVAALVMGLPANAADDAPAAPPTLQFVRNPDLHDAELSPSGRWLAVATTAKGVSRVVLAVIDLEAGQPSAKVVAAFTGADVASFRWVNDQRLVFNVVDRWADRPSDRFGPGLFAVSRDGGEPRELINSVWGNGVTGLPPNHGFLTTLHDGSDDVIVGQYRYSNTGEPEDVIPKRLNVVTGRVVPLALGAPSRTFRWLFDDRGDPRVSVAEDRGEVRVAVKRQDGSWNVISRSPVLSNKMSPVALGPDGTLYVQTPSDAGYEVLRRLGPDGRLDAEPLISAARFDLDADPIIDRESSAVLGFSFQTDAESTVWFDPAIKALQARADERFPGHINRLQCRRCTKEGVLLVYSYSDRDPGSYWLYRAKTATWEPVGAERRDIDPRTMGEVDFVRTRARDGEDLPIWITKPAGRSSAPRAAVVLVHGGPWVRGGAWRWNGEAQFLASRGYVVIEPEFRGSLGFGSAHVRKSFKQWGLTMQDDLVDAARWAADKGLVDPKRVCIAGASYGGYATLMGLVRSPETFRCGVAWAAVTDLPLMLDGGLDSDLSEESQRYSLPTMVGDPKTDAELLKEASPTTHAAKIGQPLLMAFGNADRRVPIEHGKRLRDAMHRAGLKPEYVVYDGEGHGWAQVENRVDFWNRVDRFLAQALR